MPIAKLEVGCQAKLEVVDEMLFLYSCQFRDTFKTANLSGWEHLQMFPAWLTNSWVSMPQLDDEEMWQSKH